MEIDTHIHDSRSCEESILGKNKHLDSDTARSLFEVGANLFMLDIPMNTEIGVDMNSWNTGPNFKGIKMIPPGVHFVYWRYASNFFLFNYHPTFFEIRLPIVSAFQ